MVSIENCPDDTIQIVREYTKTSLQRLIAAAGNGNINRNNLKTNIKTSTKKFRKQKWEEKQLHGYFKRQTKEIAQVGMDLAKKGKPNE